MSAPFTHAFAFKVAVLARIPSDADAPAPQFHRFRGVFTFGEIVRALGALLPPRREKFERSVVLEYTDEDGDTIRVASDIEWRECLRLQAAAVFQAAAAARAPAPSLDSIVIRLVARWGDKLRGAKSDAVAEAAVATPATVAEAEPDFSVVLDELMGVAAPAAAAAAAAAPPLLPEAFVFPVVPVATPPPADAAAADFDSLSDDDFVAAAALRADEAAFDKEERYYAGASNVPHAGAAVAMLAAGPQGGAPNAVIATANAADHAVRPWNNINNNARALHAIFPDTPLKTIKLMLRKRRNDANEVANLLASGKTLVDSA